MYHTYYDSFARIMNYGYKGILRIHSYLLTLSIRFFSSCILKAFSVIQKAYGQEGLSIFTNSL